MPHRTPAIAALLALGLMLAPACFNGAFQDHSHRNDGGNRFSLVIEADRTDVAGSHFLVDEATGDLWRLDARGAEPGEWVRLADGPTDVTPLGEGDEEGEEAEGDGA